MVQDLVHNLCESLVENIGGVAGVGKKTPSPPITYLTQWKIVGNSEIHGNEIWSCGEYNATDGKYHILVQPLGGSVADIALTEPLRKVNDVADTIEFPSGTEGKALVTRNIKSVKWSDLNIVYQKENIRFATITELKDMFQPTDFSIRLTICLSGDFVQSNAALNKTGLDMCMVVYDNLKLYIKDYSIDTPTAFQNKYGSHEILYRLATPTTELVDVSQIAEAESYSMVISQGAKAVEWSSFVTE